MALNPQQLKAVKATEGPVLIIAGPGSGKTKVLTHRIVYLIAKGVAPQNILAVTFTNKAAGEMRERVARLLKSTGNSELQFAINRRLKSATPIIGTFHSICAGILRRQINLLGYKQNFVIYDEDDQRRLIKEILKKLEVSLEQFAPARVSGAISSAKSELISAQDYQNQAFDYFEESISEIYKIYQARLKVNNALDFDDLIGMTVKLFQNYPQVLEYYQNKFQYVLVDEYQDTNTSQYVFVNLLAKEHKNIFVIGDVDQSIYTWRKADFRNIINFERDYSKAKTILLEDCYRCTQNILDAAHDIISKNTQRREKRLKALKSRGSPLIIYKARNEKQEAEFVVGRIQNLTEEENLKLKDFVVLYRTNAQSRALEEVFLKYAIPYKVIGGIKFYARREIKDILAYLKLIQNPEDSVSHNRIINVPPRKRNGSFKDFDNLILNLREFSFEQPVTKLIRTTLEKIGYEDYIKDGTREGQNRWENILELLTVAKEYNHLSPPQGLKQFLEEVSLLTDADNVETNKEVVNLMTLHCAKGLEFKVVFITGCEQRLLPHNLSQTKEEKEEERRLIYVGITRAKERVFLTYTHQRNLYGSTIKSTPSQFLKDIPPKLASYRQCSEKDLQNDEEEY